MRTRLSLAVASALAIGGLSLVGCQQRSQHRQHHASSASGTYDTRTGGTTAGYPASGSGTYSGTSGTYGTGTSGTGTYGAGAPSSGT